MRIIDVLEETYSALSANKVRTGLTMLGIIIGISSVIAMVSIGQGAQSTIQSNIESIGSNLIMISPGAQRGVGTQISSGYGSAQTLTADDAEAILDEVEGIMAIAPDVTSRYQITSKGTNTNTSVVGTNSSYIEVRNIEVEDGDFITEQNLKNLSKVAVIGPDTRDTLFGEGADAIGQTIRIKNIEFKVIGITASKGASGMSNSDDIVYVPLTTAQKYLAGNTNLSTISIQAENSDVMTQVQEEVTSLLLDRHNISDATLADFRVMNQSDIVETASSVTETFTILLGAVAGISLVVGGIGIMNMMLTTVTERTREIGLRKAIGATRKDINTQFLTESVVLTFAGGIIGMILGWLISFIISKLGILDTKIGIWPVMLAFAVSALIGIVFGYYPARRASGLNPIDALRYE